MTEPDKAEAEAAEKEGGAPAKPAVPPWAGVQAVPMRVAITVPVVRMKLADLRSLSRGVLLHTATAAAEDVPVRVGGIVFGWGELDHVDGQMAVRLTRLT